MTGFQGDHRRRKLLAYVLQCPAIRFRMDGLGRVGGDGQGASRSRQQAREVRLGGGQFLPLVQEDVRETVSGKMGSKVLISLHGFDSQDHQVRQGQGVLSALLPDVHLHLLGSSFRRNTNCRSSAHSLWLCQCWRRMPRSADRFTFTSLCAGQAASNTSTAVSSSQME